MERVGQISKTHKAKDLPYKFRSIDDVLLRLQPALIELGVAVQIETSNLQRSHSPSAKGSSVVQATVDVALRFIAPDGTYIENRAAGEARDYSDKATNKAITSGVKNALLHALMAPTGTKRDPEHSRAPKDRPRKLSDKSREILAQIRASASADEVTAVMNSSAYQSVPEQERADVRQVALSQWKRLTARAQPGGPDDWPVHDFATTSPIPTAPRIGRAPNGVHWHTWTTRDRRPGWYEGEWSWNGAGGRVRSNGSDMEPVEGTTAPSTEVRLSLAWAFDRGSK